MEDLRQLNVPSAVESVVRATPAKGPKTDSDSASFEALLAETGVETATAYGKTFPETLSQPAPATPATTALIPSSDEVAVVVLDAPQSSVSSVGSVEPGDLTHFDLAEEVASRSLDSSIARLRAPGGPNVEPGPLSGTAEDFVEALGARNPETRGWTPSAGESGPVEVTSTSGATKSPAVVHMGVSNPVVGPVGWKSLESLDLASVGVNRMEVAGEDSAEALVPRNLETGGRIRSADSPSSGVRRMEVAGEDLVEASGSRNLEIGGETRLARERGAAGVTSKSVAPTSPSVMRPGVSNPVVPSSDGKSLESLDLASFGVNRMVVTAEGRSASDATARPQTAVVSSEAVVSTNPRREPTPATEGHHPLAGLAGRFPAGRESASVSDSVNSHTATTQAHRPEAAIPSGAVLESKITSTYIVNGREIRPTTAEDSKGMTSDGSLNTVETRSTRSFVQMTSEIPAETGGSASHTEAQLARPAQPVKPINLPKFSLDPARRVTMMVGEADAGVRVQLSENRGAIAVRFDAPALIRAGLEASIHNLLESFTREQVPLSGVQFSGRFDTGTDSDQRHRDDGRGFGHAASAVTEIEDRDFMTEFEASDTDSVVSLTA